MNFVSIFCPELQELLKPIYELTKKGRPFVWGEELVDIGNPTDADPTLESKTPSPKSVRKPPSGWAEFRRRTISKAMQENSKHIAIEKCKSISTEEFNNNM